MRNRLPTTLRLRRERLAAACGEGAYLHAERQAVYQYGYATALTDVADLLDQLCEWERVDGSEPWSWWERNPALAPH